MLLEIVPPFMNLVIQLMNPEHTLHQQGARLKDREQQILLLSFSWSFGDSDTEITSP